MNTDFMRMLEDAFPLQFLRDTARFIIDAYRLAHEACQSRPWQVAHDYRGHRRRADIEDGWNAIAERFADEGVHAQYLLNASGSSYFLQIASKSLVLTQSHVESRNTVVRQADFRNTRALLNQRSLFEEETTPPIDSAVYAILIHGSDGCQSQPAFMDIVFPSPDCESYVGRVNLFDICPEVFASPAAEEVIPDEATPHLRAQENRSV